MRLGLRAKEAIAVTLLTLLVVATTTLIHMGRLSTVVIQEAERQAELIAKQIYARSSRTLARAPGGDLRQLLRRDLELRSLVDASVGYSPHLLYALIADTRGRIILHSEPVKENQIAPERPSLHQLLALDAVRRFQALYQGQRIYESALAINLNNEPFGSIRLGLAASLLQRELNASLKQSLMVAVVALPVAWLVAMGLANLTLRPIRRLARDVERLRRGELDLGRDPARREPTDEFGELASQLQVLGKDLQTDRLQTLSTKLVALGSLTTGVAHEVKNPLNAMMIHLELLKGKLDLSSEDVQRSVEVMGSEIRRLDRVVQGFLKFIRPQELALQPVDLNALLRNVSGLLEAEWEKAGIQFALQLALDLTAITADEELLRQVFLNLMLNACQAMPKGGTVSVTTARRPRDNREMLAIAIADEGVGIAPEDQDKIFKLYYTTKPDGNGIGLSLVYRIVQMHDGVIEVDSVVDKGTTMTVWLPAC